MIGDPSVMNDSHSHCPHSHTAAEAKQLSRERLKVLQGAFLLTVVYMIAEAIGGVISGSLALLADAGHMLADAGAIALALFAAWICQRETNGRKTYGYYRMEILAAFMNGLLLAGVSFWVLFEAFQRLTHPHPIMGGIMTSVALGGLIVNLLVIRLLHGGTAHDMNLRGAYLHVLGDLLGSVGALGAAILIFFWGMTWADSAISILIAALVLISAFRLSLEAVDILMESCPAHLDTERVHDAMLALDGVVAIHDLHLWTIASGKHALSAHVTVADAAFNPETLSRLQHCLKEQFDLSHVTLQLEPPGFEEDEIHF